MTTIDFRKTPDARPWAVDLAEGDVVTEAQKGCVDGHRLQEFGLMFKPHRNGKDWRVAWMSRADRADYDRSRVCNVGVW